MPELSQPQQQILLSNPWFAALPAPVRRDLAARARPREVAAGAMVYRRGDGGDGLYGVLEGAVRLSGTSMAGKEATVGLMEPGSWFGELSMIDGLPRAHDACAHGATRLLQVAPADFHALLDAHPALARHLLQLQSARVRALLAGVEAFLMQPGEQRFALRLLELARQYGSETAQGMEIDLALSQELLSQLVGVTRQRVSQILRAWEKDGVIAHHYGRVTVRDASRLARLAQG
ncbi:putative transcription regulator, Crp family [Cupriavidus phytorum]|uniref:Transcription regulator, Crp family n=2 Tax=Cupriavidus TaxID=106589 RepID=A0A975XBK3_9BURK|nr:MULTISPECIES: Crp/Fnr family transcriptional regulator [Cupriavidus]PZX33976.1 Crp/Fnr family transcriptional regulator [Cupriavidus alkaliphilus]SOY65517.1 putative transcription regulator, Crp family [Cupriavidus taiwanensis]